MLTTCLSRRSASAPSASRKSPMPCPVASRPGPEQSLRPVAGHRRPHVGLQREASRSGKRQRLLYHHAGSGLDRLRAGRIASVDRGLDLLLAEGRGGGADPRRVQAHDVRPVLRSAFAAHHEAQPIARCRAPRIAVSQQARHASPDFSSSSSRHSSSPQSARQRSLKTNHSAASTLWNRCSGSLRTRGGSR